MHGREIAFAAAQCRDAAEAADGDGPRRKAALGERAHDDVERDIVAAHDDEIGRPRRVANQRHLGACVGVERCRERIDGKKSVGLRKRSDGARAFAARKSDRAVFAGHQGYENELLAAEFRSDPHRHARRDGSRTLRRKPRPRADHRSDEGMEREDGGGRKARQHDEWLVTDHRETKRLAGFQRHAMDEDPGLAEPRHDAMR